MFSNIFAVLDKRQSGLNYLESFGTLSGSGNAIILLASKTLENGTAEGNG
jgi:hypothetical protein